MNEKYWRGNVLVHECRNGARMNFHDTHSNIWIYPVNRKAVPVWESFVPMGRHT